MRNHRVEKKNFNPVEQCKAEKLEYDGCFKQWYGSKFMQGKLEMNEECEHQFEALQVCINKAVEHHNRTRNRAQGK